MLVRTPQRLFVILCLCGFIFAAENAGIWLDVPFVQQEKDGCGAAVIAMLMLYWQKQQPRASDAPADPVEIQRVLFSRRGRGIYASDLERYFQSHGFRTFSFKGTWEDLRHHLERGRPLIAALKPGVGETSLHYVVVAGLDRERNLVLVNDPAQKKLLKMERATFEKQWSAVDYWTLLALPK